MRLEDNSAQKCSRRECGGLPDGSISFGTFEFLKELKISAHK